MRVNSIFVTAFPLTELGSSLTHSLTLTHKSSQVKSNERIMLVNISFIHP